MVKRSGFRASWSAFQWSAVVAAACWLAACASTQENAGDALARAAQAMGTDAAQRPCATPAEGTGHTFGQAYKPGGAWPRITLHSVTRTIDYASGAMRDEIVLSRAEPLGGGGYPLAGPAAQRPVPQRRASPGTRPARTATPGPRFVTDRHAPALDHAARRAEGGAAQQRARATRRRRRLERVAFTEPGRFSADGARSAPTVS